MNVYINMRKCAKGHEDLNIWPQKEVGPVTSADL